MSCISVIDIVTVQKMKEHIKFFAEFRWDLRGSYTEKNAYAWFVSFEIDDIGLNVITQ